MSTRIVVGQGSCGLAAGAGAVYSALEEKITSASLSITGCIGICYLEPIVDVYAEDGKLYRCVQAHASQDGWEPDKTPALWTEVAKPGEIPVWRQPTGAQDAYNKGDKVHYPTADDPVYVSTIDANVWSPDDYPQGWEEVT